MTQTKTNYVAIEGFDLAKWYEDFFLDESDSILNHMPGDMILKLAVMDHKGFTLSGDDTSAPVGYRIVRKRCDFLKFPCSDAVCLFISMLGDRPGKLVMICVAYAIAWDVRKETLLPDLCPQIVAPNMDWILELHNEGFKAGDEFIPCDSFGFPGEEHLHKMWDAQKIGGGNGLDTVYFKDPSIL